jgi:hypothetical protein
VFVPTRRYPAGFTVSVSSGRYTIEAVAGGELVHWSAAGGSGTHSLRITPGDRRRVIASSMTGMSRRPTKRPPSDYVSSRVPPGFRIRSSNHSVRTKRADRSP